MAKLAERMEQPTFYAGWTHLSPPGEKWRKNQCCRGLGPRAKDKNEQTLGLAAFYPAILGGCVETAGTRFSARKPAWDFAAAAIFLCGSVFLGAPGRLSSRFARRGILAVFL